MKKQVLLVTFLILTTSLMGQNLTNVRPFEVEVGFGACKGMKSKDDKVKSELGVLLFIEARLNLKDSPFDVALQLSAGSYERKMVLYNEYIMPKTFVAYTNYNYRKSKRLSFFGGIGIGTALINDEFESSIPKVWYKSKTKEQSFLLSTRLGVELFNRLRVGIDHKLIKSDYSFWALHMGFTLGGGIKK